MQNAITILTVVGGLVFSLSCALLAEELIFGGLFKLFFHPRPAPVKVESNPNRNTKRNQ